MWGLLSCSHSGQRKDTTQCKGESQDHSFIPDVCSKGTNAAETAPEAGAEKGCRGNQGAESWCNERDLELHGLVSLAKQG